MAFLILRDRILNKNIQAEFRQRPNKETIEIITIIHKCCKQMFLNFLVKIRFMENFCEQFLTNKMREFFISAESITVFLNTKSHHGPFFKYKTKMLMT